MKTFLLSLGLVFSLIASPLAVDAAVKVKGYFRKDGTYVQPHYRSNPDGNPYNNYSFPGSTNPYTGKVAPGNAETYLKNYYDDTTSYSATLPSTSYTSGLSSLVTSPSVQTPKYQALTKGPEWVEYVGQDDACAQIYDTYRQSLARLKAQYSPVPLKSLYADSREYATAVTFYNFNTSKVDIEIDALWFDAEQKAYQCYQTAKTSSTPAVVTTAAATGSGVTLAELVELFIALGVIPSEKAEQARSVLMHAPGQ